MWDKMLIGKGDGVRTVIHRSIHREAVADVGPDARPIGLLRLAPPDTDHVRASALGSQGRRNRVREALAAEPIQVVELLQGEKAGRAYKLFRRALPGVSPE